VLVRAARWWRSVLAGAVHDLGGSQVRANSVCTMGELPGGFLWRSRTGLPAGSFCRFYSASGFGYQSGGRVLPLVFALIFCVLGDGSGLF
jgi:hypothetical protein